MKYSNGVAWSPLGLRIEVMKSPMRNKDHGSGLVVLHVEDLNPHVEMTNCLTKWQLFRLGIWLAFKSIRPNAFPSRSGPVE